MLTCVIRAHIKIPINKNIIFNDTKNLIFIEFNDARINILQVCYFGLLFDKICYFKLDKYVFDPCKYSKFCFTPSKNFLLVLVHIFKSNHA
jgi:hypothetical protein